MSTRWAGAFLFLDWLGLGSLAAADPPAQPKLIGLTHSADGRPLAMLELGRGGNGRPPERLALHEGERLGGVEVLAIDDAKAQVHLRLAGTEITVPLATGTTNAAPPDESPPLSLRQADLGTVLPIYSELSGRTVLQHPGLPVVSLSLDAPPGNRLDTLHALEALLATNGIVVVPSGEHFVKIVPKSVAMATLTEREPKNQTTAELARPKSAGEAAKITTGLINFPNLDWQLAAKMYAEIRQRTLIPPASDLPGGNIVLRTPTALTREEVCYALETLFRWHQIVFEDVGDKSIKAVLAGKAK